MGRGGNNSFTARFSSYQSPEHKAGAELCLLLYLIFFKMQKPIITLPVCDVQYVYGLDVSF